MERYIKSTVTTSGQVLAVRSEGVGETELLSVVNLLSEDGKEFGFPAKDLDDVMILLEEVRDDREGIR